MTFREYLKEAEWLNEQILEILDKANLMRNNLYGRAVNYENAGTNSGNSADDSLGKALAKIMDFEKSADVLIDQLVEKKIVIEKHILKLTDVKLRRILEKKYLLFESNEKIAADLKYSVNHVYKLKNQAIRIIEEVWIQN